MNGKRLALKLLKETPKLLLAPVVVGVLAIVLHLLGLVPAYIQGNNGIIEYSGIEAAESGLGFKIIIPAYFPSYLAWPPARIEGRLEPERSVELLFLSSSQQTRALVIRETVTENGPLPLPLPWIDTVQETMSVAIGESEGKLLVGLDANGQVVNGVAWRDGNMTLVMVTTRPVPELLTLARSMHP